MEIKRPLVDQTVLHGKSRIFGNLSKDIVLLIEVYKCILYLGNPEICEFVIPAILLTKPVFIISLFKTSDDIRVCW